jgi:hypothetical protein
MKEEARVFLRTAAYALLVAGIYWFVSYEVAGTVLLIVLGVAAAALTAMLPGRTKVLRAPLELATFGEGEEPIMEIEEVPLPTLSLQPLLVALGAAGVTLGLVFGAWLWLPGILILLGAAWRWHTELG